MQFAIESLSVKLSISIEMINACLVGMRHTKSNCLLHYPKDGGGVTLLTGGMKLKQMDGLMASVSGPTFLAYRACRAFSHYRDTLVPPHGELFCPV